MQTANFLIEHQCPQCGAPATLTETDRLVTCPFCRVKSYLMPGDYFRYALPANAPVGMSLFYFPYWRFKGMLFSSLQGGVQQRFIDVSYQAIPSRHFPVSVGFRSQALKLQFVSPDINGEFLSCRQTLDRITEIFDDRFQASLPKPVYLQSHIGESISLIYSPYYLTDKLYDAVIDEPVVSAPPEEIETLAASGHRADWHIKFVSTLCPQCGWDLDGDRDSLVLLCRNCDTAWQAGKNRLKQIRFGHLVIKEDDVLYLPFWRIKAELKGIELESYADLVRVANLPKVIQEEWTSIPFRFWAPGFKIRPQTFLPLAQKMTLTQPQETFEQTLPKQRPYPVNLPIEEAVESLKMTLASFVKPRRILLPKLSQIPIKPKSYLLVYVPFIIQHHELIQPFIKFTITKNQLALSKNL